MEREEPFQTVLILDQPIRVRIIKEEPWFLVRDLSNVMGIDRTTIPKIIERSPRDFEGWYLLCDVTSPEEISFNRGNLKKSGKSDLLINEQAVYLTFGSLTGSRVKRPEAAEMIHKFKRAYPEILKALRKGELQPPKTLENTLRNLYNSAYEMRGRGCDLSLFKDLICYAAGKEIGFDETQVQSILQSDLTTHPDDVICNFSQLMIDYDMDIDEIKRSMLQLGWVGYNKIDGYYITRTGGKYLIQDTLIRGSTRITRYGLNAYRAWLYIKRNPSFEINKLISAENMGLFLNYFHNLETISKINRLPDGYA